MDTPHETSPVATDEPTTNTSVGQATQDDVVATVDTETATVAAPPSAVATTPSEPDSAPSTMDTALVEAAAQDAATDLARTDTANTTLATLAGVLLTVLTAGAGITSGDGSFPTAALAAMGAAAALLAGVLVTLASAMWPRRGGAGGVPHYATLTPAALATELATANPAHWHAERAVAKARIAARKYRAQRLGGTGLAAAGLLLAAATILTLAQ